MAAATESVVAAAEVADQTPATRGTVLDAARSAFLDGMAAARRVAALAAIVGAVAADAFLPARADVEPDHHDADIPLTAAMSATDP